MSRWYRQDLVMVMGLRVKCEVTPEVPYLAATWRVAKDLASMAPAMGIDLSDVKTRIQEAPERQQQVLVGCWMPEVREVEIVGGYHDGRAIMLMPDMEPVRDDFYVPNPEALGASSPGLPPLKRGVPETPEALGVRVSCCGWDPDRRLWLYSPEH